MSDPISGVSGLASGIQWRDLVDQIMRLETQRRLDPLTSATTLSRKRTDAWTSWQTLMSKFRDATRGLRDATAFSQFKLSGGTSSATGRTLLSASAGPGAAPGSYDIEVMDLARSNKLSGAVQTSNATALGLAGEFTVNGRAVTLLATDSLNAIRDKINAVNVGATASGVTATVLSTGAAEHRLVLTADQTGATGVELVDDAAGTLQSLGLVDSTKSLNLGASGGAQSYRVSSATAVVAAMLGVTMPPPTTITVGGRAIVVDLSVDSLTSIAAKIAAAGGNATVTTETAGGKTYSRLVTNDTVGASTPDGQRALEVLGFIRNGRSGVTQALTSDNTFSVAGGGAAATGTLLSALEVGGNPLGINTGDSVTLQGRRGDGSTVNVSFTVGAGDTVQTLLNKLNDATSGYGAGSRTATASLVNGQVVLTDSVAGDSQLSLAMSVTASGGGIINLGRVSVSTVGRQREVVAGSDAALKVDGVVLRRSSNTVSDAIAGLTLNLQQAEVGEATTLVVDRDTDAIAKAVGDVATAYNDLLKFRTEQAKADAPLHNNSTLRSSMASLTSAILGTVTGATAGLTTAGMAGLSLQKDGSLVLDASLFKAKLASNFADVTALFATSGATTNAALSYVFSTEKSVPGTYAVDVTTAASVASVTGAGFAGTYADDATPDTLTIADASTGNSGSISLTNGDTIDTIVANLNAMFAANKLNVTASKSGNELVLAGTQYGSASTVTVSYAAGGTDGSAQLGLAAGTYAGVDIVGTIGGFAATGAGQVLTGNAGSAVEGLAVRYTGSTTGALGSITFVLGVSGALYNAADVVARTGGTVTDQLDTLQRRITDLQSRTDTVQQALDRRRQALVKQFTEMERALSRIQQQGSSISGFLAQLNASNG